MNKLAFAVLFPIVSAKEFGGVVKNFLVMRRFKFEMNNSCPPCYVRSIKCTHREAI